MTEPVYGSSLERMYARLPETLRVADSVNNYTLKRYLLGIGSQMNDLDLLLNRFDVMDSLDKRALQMIQNYHYERVVTLPGSLPMHDTSDLSDPKSADAEWLPWLAQLVGVDVQRLLNEQERRDAVQFASSGFKAGSQQALEDAVRSELTGSRYVRIFTHSTDVTDGIGNGTQWDVLIITKVSETVDASRIINTVNRKGAKPVGVKLWHRTFEASWDTTDVFTWAQRDQLTWDQLEEQGVMSEGTPTPPTITYDGGGPSSSVTETVDSGGVSDIPTPPSLDGGSP